VTFGRWISWREKQGKIDRSHADVEVGRKGFLKWYKSCHEKTSIVRKADITHPTLEPVTVPNLAPIPLNPIPSTRGL
jgi:hypothetical protein